MTRLAAALVLLAAAAPARAADAVLAKVKGQVYVRAAGSDKYLRAKGGEELIFGDRVRTAPEAVAQVVFRDGAGAVLVRGDSSFLLQGDPAHALLNFRIGEFLVGLRKALGPGETFRVRTPAAVAAVRGTLFWGKTDADETTTYAGFGHDIEVTAQGKTVVVHAGEKTTVAKGAAPEAPAKHDIPLSFTDNFKVDGDLQSLETLVDLPKP